MTPSQIAESFHAGLERLESLPAFSELSEFSARFSNTLSTLVALVTNGRSDDLQRASTNAQEAISAAKQLDDRSIYQDFSRIIAQDVLRFVPPTSFDRIATSLEGGLNDLLKTYGAFLKTHGIREVAFFLLSARDFVRIVSIAKAAVAPLALSRPGSPSATSPTIIDVVFDDGDSVYEFSQRLKAVDSLYVSCCHLLAIDITQHPLAVVLIESGSARIVAEGAEKAIGVLTQLLNLSSNLIRRTFTKNGQLEVVVDRGKLGKTLIDFRNQAEANGIDTSRLDDMLQRLTNDIATSLEQIVGKDGNVEVNRHSLQIETDRKSLPPGAQTRLLN